MWIIDSLEDSYKEVKFFSNSMTITPHIQIQTPEGNPWSVEEGGPGSGPWCEEREGIRYSALVVALRFIRVFRWVPSFLYRNWFHCLLRFVRLLRLYFEHHNVVKSVRQRVCENKRRFQADGYDLDLTYVTTHIIAMSFPSKGGQKTRQILEDEFRNQSCLSEQDRRRGKVL